MLAKVLQLTESKINRDELIAQLEAELKGCEMVCVSYRNKLKAFMIENEIWHISDLNYYWRIEYEKYLKIVVNGSSCTKNIKAFDQVKLYSIRNQPQITISGKGFKSAYADNILYMPYHPDIRIAEMFLKENNRNLLAWDFTQRAPLKMKRQVFEVLHFFIENAANRERMHAQLGGLLRLYNFCIQEQIEDLEKLELDQIERYKDTLETDYQKHYYGGVTSWCARALFLMNDDINWDANVWYMERLHLPPERLDPAESVTKLSFAEVTHKENRRILQMYTKYNIGITNLSISNIRSELICLRNFLESINQPETENVYTITAEQIDAYFKDEQKREIQEDTYNKKIMCILHFFNYLQVKGYIDRVPFDPDYYMKKTFQKHHDRSVDQEVIEEIMDNLYKFPEEIRLMFLHLWGIGLRISEVCILKGNAYYLQGDDAWIQVYQTKMRTYKRIPIPMAIYRLMKVYIEKYSRKADEYIFQNEKGEAYKKNAFRHKMLKACKVNNIKNGEYVFKSHDYRHSIATTFYEEGVPIQSIRDYLGHDYEEMTLQYVDYMPKKVEKANEDFFKKGSLASRLGKGVKENG